MTQETALAILKTGANVFLTGEPGAGKTHTINTYVDYLRSHAIEPAITASTGIAATHIGGMTIHSWSGIGIQKILSTEDIERISHNKKLAHRATGTNILIIDEISMLDGHTLFAVDTACKALRNSTASFGGMQVVFVGDFFQLPPVSRAGDAPMKFAFLSPSWSEANPTVCYLSEQHRQEDDVFLSFLSSLRNQNITNEVRAMLSSRIVAEAEGETHTRLYSHNADVDRINNEKLSKLPGITKQYTMGERGPSAFVGQLKKGCLSPEILALKVSAKVMFTKNNYEEGFANGTLGEVTGFNDEGMPVVKITYGRTVTVKPMEWTIADGSRVLARITQLPLRLAWALTIHKSQGMTLSSAVIDLQEAFEFGQGYVALSRVKTFSGLFLLGFNNRSLEVHPEIFLHDASFRAQSNAAQQMIDAVLPDVRLSLEKKFIHACGGTVEGVYRSNKKTNTKDRKKGATYAETLQLLKDNKSIAEIAEARGLTVTTIYGHVEKLYIDSKIDKEYVIRLLPEHVVRGLPQIHTALKESDGARLAPLFEKFKGQYSYEDLRLARLLL